MPERNPATCQLESEQALMAAPPVEKSSAAPKRKKRFFAALDNLQSNSFEKPHNGLAPVRPIQYAYHISNQDSRAHHCRKFGA